MNARRLVMVLLGGFLIVGHQGWAQETAVDEAANTAASQAVTVDSESSPAQELIDSQLQVAQLTARFGLTIKGAGPKGKDYHAEGKMWLASGRRYAVQYEMPERQRLVSSGIQRWLYFEKINQVQIQSMPPAGNPTEFFLEIGGGLPNLIRRCDVTRLPGLPQKPKSRGYLLVPKSGEALEFEEARIWVEGKQSLPLAVSVKAAKTVEVKMQSVVMQTSRELEASPQLKLPASMFEFAPPADAEVIEMF